MGSFQGKRVAVTGASGTLGQALLLQFYREGAVVVALSSRSEPVTIALGGEAIALKTQVWQVGQEALLADLLKTIDILVINHGVNVHGDRTPEAIQRSYEVNTWSGWRLLELFFSTVDLTTASQEGPVQRLGWGARLAGSLTQFPNLSKEVWINTSEAEVNPAFSPLYELSKRTMGDLITLRRLDAPCVVRKLILGPFKSNLNPVGVMSAERVAAAIVRQAGRDRRNIIVTINPLTWLLFPLKEWMVSQYFRWLTRKA